MAVTLESTCTLRRLQTCYFYEPYIPLCLFTCILHSCGGMQSTTLILYMFMYINAHITGSGRIAVSFHIVFTELPFLKGMGHITHRGAILVANIATLAPIHTKTLEPTKNLYSVLRICVCIRTSLQTLACREVTRSLLKFHT